jgi:hypothetical protein
MDIGGQVDAGEDGVEARGNACDVKILAVGGDVGAAGGEAEVDGGKELVGREIVAVDGASGADDEELVAGGVDDEFAMVGDGDEGRVEEDAAFEGFEADVTGVAGLSRKRSMRGHWSTYSQWTLEITPVKHLA